MQPTLHHTGWGNTCEHCGMWIEVVYHFPGGSGSLVHEPDVCREFWANREHPALIERFWDGLRRKPA